MMSDLKPLQKEIAKELGYELVGHRLELYGTSLKRTEKKQ
jgi:Fe2+/Zn2+ uptake regulation proteins